MAHPDEVETWDALYRKGEHRKRWHYKEPGQELVALVASGAVRPCPSLDIGCGAGVEAVWLAKHGFEAHGVDFSPAALRLARARAARAGVRVDFRQADVRAMPYPARSFGLVTDRSCLHTLYRRDWPRFASEVGRVTRPGGTLFLRSARTTAGGGFTHLRKEDLKRYFGRRFRTVGFEKTSFLSDSGDLPSYLAILRRR